LATRSRDLLESLFRSAVAAAHPSRCLPPRLPEPPARGRLIVLAAGKAAGSLTEVAEAHYLARLPQDRLSGIAVTRHGYGRPTKLIPVVEAGHPVPDEAGLAGAEKMLTIADAAGADDLVLVLLSGGASANLIAPAPGISFADKQAATRAILRSGANIGEFNCVRKHLSRIKGGRLTKHAHPAKVVTLAISDVPGDDPAVIGSGPTVPDPTTLADARAVVANVNPQHLFQTLVPREAVPRAMAARMTAWKAGSGTFRMNVALSKLPEFSALPGGGDHHTAGIILAIMILPIVSAISREVMSTVPDDHKEAALGLGATRWEMLRIAVLPYCRSGIVGGAMLGLGRAIGETIAVTILVGDAPVLGKHLFGQGYSLAAAIANEFGEAQELHRSALFAAGLVLFVLTLLVNVAARLLVMRAERSTKPKRTAADFAETSTALGTGMGA